MRPRWHGPEFIPDLTQLSVGHWQDTVTTEDVMKYQCHILLHIAAFSYQADSKRKMWNGKHDEFCKMLGSVEVTTCLSSCSLAELQWLCSCVRVKFLCWHCPWSCARIHSAVGWPGPLLYLKKLEIGTFILWPRPAESDKTRTCDLSLCLVSGPEKPQPMLLYRTVFSTWFIEPFHNLIVVLPWKL